MGDLPFHVDRRMSIDVGCISRNCSCVMRSIDNSTGMDSLETSWKSH